MMPCESWPARLALTQPTATAFASSSEAPAALKSAVPIRERRSALTIRMGFPQHCRIRPDTDRNAAPRPGKKKTPGRGTGRFEIRCRKGLRRLLLLLRLRRGAG